MIINYTVTVTVPNKAASRLGQDFSLDTSAGIQHVTEMHPLAFVDNFVVAETGDQLSEEVTVKGDGYRTGALTIYNIENAYFDDWNEFYQSTRRREYFTIDARDIRGHNEVYVARRTDTDNGIKHREICTGYSLSFTFKVLN